MVLKFVRENGGWFIDLPEWTGAKADLAMVSGADTFLDFISAGKSRVFVDVAMKKPVRGAETWLTLVMEKEDGGGGNYRVLGLEHRMWLCSVTKFVFGGKLPRKLYFRKR